MLSGASPEGRRWVLRRISAAFPVALLLACACSRTAEAPAGTTRDDGVGAGAPTSAAEAHLARGEALVYYEEALPLHVRASGAAHPYVGLARGFLYAGAASLLVSLWPVSDDAAASLVPDFYRELLAGRSKARALREAKLRTMGRNPEFAKPFYWSSLVLVGNPK